MFRFGFHITLADLFTGLLILGILLATVALASQTIVIDQHETRVTPAPVVSPVSIQSPTRLYLPASTFTPTETSW